MEKKESSRTLEMSEISERLKNQIINGCGGSLCTGIFCKLSDIDEIVDEIAGLLLEYGDYFTCDSLYFVHGRTVHEAETENKNTMRLGLHPNLSTSFLPQINNIQHTQTAEKDHKTQTRGSLAMAKNVLKYFYLSVRSNGHMSHSASPLIRTDGCFSAGVLPSGENQFRIKRCPDENSKKEYLKMELARIIHRKKPKSTAIMLQGLFYHELNRLRVSYSVPTTVRIVKLFNAVKECVKFEKKYFIRFLEAAEKLCDATKAESLLCMEGCNKMVGGLSYNRQPECGFKEEEEFPISRNCIPRKEISARVLEECPTCNGSLEDCEYPHCDTLCYGSNKLCVNELIDLIKSLIIVIDNTSVINMREGTLLLAILKSLRALYRFSVETGIIHHSIFINRRFSRLLNYKVEIRYHKEGGPSIFDFPFILDMAAKSDLIQIENTDRMKAELQDAFFRSLFEGKIPPYLNLEIHRESVVQDSLKLLQSIKDGMAWKQLKIKFRGEDGVDSGGIKKEFFQILSQKTLGEWDIFKDEGGILWFKLFSPEEMEARRHQYRILGSILGLAAYNGAVLCFYFPQVFYKRLLGYAGTLDDLKTVEPKIYQTLTQMRDMSPEEIESLGLEYALNGKVYGVTAWNLEEFIEVYCKEILEVRLEPAFNLIKDGLWSICGDTFIRSLLPCELSILIGGMECVNMEEIEKYTIYNGYRRDSPFVQSFWEIFKQYDKNMQKKFLRFVTGTDRAPSGGLSRMALVFMRNGGDTDRLPSSQTCFNTFLIPEYSDKKKLKEKLDLAISHTEGFFLL
ncbi:ubiquitin-protein ligase E3 A [Nematocida minor]|uniref:ubiquitin-protein ligase E3 A n=1 Tax=Nematocida minor TaxID=1912983 RepID=UPI0022208DDF|nr:ubiquitin-protein ligase E3 A [Nematocida minor]KAI5191449.1 ubiquitin-protein ligase E3 A [Nematocida minor]